MNRLRELRTARKISQISLSMELNITQAAISKYEVGKAEPDINMLCRIADYFNVSVDYLIGRTDSRDALMSDDERKLLSDYKRLDRIRKAKLQGYADGLSDALK